jgi:hypothetical protein
MLPRWSQRIATAGPSISAIFAFGVKAKKNFGRVKATTGPLTLCGNV